MKRSWQVWRFVVAAVILAAAVVPIVVARAGVDSAEPREIRFVVRDMTFYLEGQDAPNPTLRVRTGERIRIVVRNEDAGMDHDLAIASWQVVTPPLKRKGQEGSVAFRVPGPRGVETYTCTPHSEMMRGTIHIE